MSGALEVAESLYNNSTNEGEWRAAASRAYYASFQHIIRHSRLTDFVPTKKGDDHQRLIEHLKNSKDSDLQRIGHRHLHRLRALRNHADYNLRTPFTKGLAEDALERASEIIFELLP